MTQANAGNSNRSLSPFHPNLKRHLRIRRFVIVPNVHLIAFRRAQHDEVQILRVNVNEYLSQVGTNI